MKPTISDSYYKHIIVDNQDYMHCIIYSDGKIISIEVGHEITLDFVKSFLKPKIELVIIGTGTEGVAKVSPDVKPFFDKKGIELFISITPKAREKFNTTTKNAVAILHGTC
jgi:hypothetical protein